jgi:hypothetical protein
LTIGGGDFDYYANEAECIADCDIDGAGCGVPVESCVPSSSSGITVGGGSSSSSGNVVVGSSSSVGIIPFTTITAINAYLASASGGATADNPVYLPVEMDLGDMRSSGFSPAVDWNSAWWQLVLTLHNRGKFVSLDISRCLMNGTEYPAPNGASGNYISGLAKIVSLALPNAVQTLAYDVFPSNFYENLASITIPASVTNINISSTNTFRIRNITVDPNNLNYSSEDGVLFDKTKTVLLRYPAGKTGVYTIPATVRTIGEFAFYNCTLLTGINNLSNVTTIGQRAFEGCRGLTSITIPSGITVINYGVFTNCSGLTSVEIPSGVTSIGEWAFSGCTSLVSVTIPSGVTIIGQSAFRDCTILPSITIPASVTYIEAYAFRGCTKLASVTFQGTGIGISSDAFMGVDYGSSSNPQYSLVGAYSDGGLGTYTATTTNSNVTSTSVWTKQ